MPEARGEHELFVRTSGGSDAQVHLIGLRLRVISERRVRSLYGAIYMAPSVNTRLNRCDRSQTRPLGVLVWSRVALRLVCGVVDGENKRVGVVRPLAARVGGTVGGRVSWVGVGSS